MCLFILMLMDKKSYEDFELRLIEKHLRPTARIDFVKHKAYMGHA